MQDILKSDHSNADYFIEALYNTYLRQVEDHAISMYHSVIEPFLIENDYRFISGNGTWVISDGLPRFVPEKIANILNMTVLGTNNYLAEFMPQKYNRKLEKGKR